MTDNEIIKALESEMHLAKYVDSDYCSNVNLDIIKSAFDLINRLQAQNKDLAETIHNLTLEKDALFDKAEELKVEVERLENALLARMNYLNIIACDESDVSFIKISTDLNKQIRADIKSEAVKEFAEELKHILRNTPKLSVKKLNFNNVVFYDDVLFSIDNLLEEMVGERRMTDLQD